MLKIEDHDQLMYLLKSLASKSSPNTNREYLLEQDSYIAKFKKNLNSEIDQLKEQEEEEEEEEEATPEEETGEEEDEEDPPTEEEGEEAPKKNTNFAAEKAIDFIDYEKGIDASLSNILTALNTLRAGKSTKDKTIKGELGIYYNRLDENEKEILLLYLNELSKILTGATQGDQAQDPSEASTYYEISKRDDSAVRKKVSQKSNQTDQTSKDANMSKPDIQKGLEDTTPPIKVNESQNYSGLYKIS